MKKKKQNKHVKQIKGGINNPAFWSLLTILFIGLKLTGHIDWSWWLVLLPKILELALHILGRLLIWGYNKVLDLIAEMEKEELNNQNKPEHEGSGIDAQL